MYYWYDPTLNTDAVRGQTRRPFGDGPTRFYYDRTLQYQAPRMGLHGGHMLAASPDTFRIVRLSDGMTKAVATTPETATQFRQVQLALNTAAKSLRLPYSVPITGEIDPMTASLALMIGSERPDDTVLGPLGRLGTTREAQISAVPYLAANDAVISALKRIHRIPSRGQALAIMGSVVTLAALGAVLVLRR